MKKHTPSDYNYLWLGLKQTLKQNTESKTGQVVLPFQIIEYSRYRFSLMKIKQNQNSNSNTNVSTYEGLRKPTGHKIAQVEYFCVEK